MENARGEIFRDSMEHEPAMREDRALISALQSLIMAQVLPV